MENPDRKKEFTAIYEKEVDAIYRYVILRVSDREEVRDIIQDTFARFWQKLNSGSVIEYPRSFIFAVARNRIIDWYRKKKAQSLESMMESEDNAVFEIPDENTHKAMESFAEASVIMKALNRLSSQYREVVYLRFVENLLPNEIAEVLGATPNAISVRINRGLEELRKILKINLHPK